MVDAPVFAYAPILRCLQNMVDLPLSKELFRYTRGDGKTESGLIPKSILDQFTAESDVDIEDV